MTGTTYDYADVIAGMKRRLNRSDDASEADEEISKLSNRGNKLKHNSRYVQEGKLDVLNGPKMYKRTINHAGFTRTIIHRNPPKVDEDGDIVEDEDEQQEPVGEPIEENPYQDVKLEEILGPLTKVSDLATHPSMSRPFTDAKLNELIQTAGANLRRELASLARMKQVLLPFRGDVSFAPGDIFLTEQDTALLEDPELASSSELDDEDGRNGQVEPSGQDGRQGEQAIQSQEKKNGESHPESTTSVRDFNGATTALAPDNVARDTDTSMADAPAASRINGDSGHQNGTTNGAAENGETEKDEAEENDNGSDTASQPHPMTTRRRAAADASSNADSDADNQNPPAIHPLFGFPDAAVPDRNCGLPPGEAEETRTLLVLYVQKQEEVVRQTQEIYSKLLKADHMRKEVIKAAKAEGHVGELSDGEDWYDLEEWGLTEDLAKGKEELVEEEEVTQKKTRGRRN